MTSLLAIDPGGTSGWALFSFDAMTPLTLVTHGQIEGGLRGWLEAAASLNDGLMGDLKATDQVVIEDFILDGRTPKADTTALEIIGAVEQYCYDFIPLTRQRNLMKAHADDLLLKRAGLWLPGQQHARDAVRHSIAWAKATRHMPTLKWLYPPDAEA